MANIIMIKHGAEAPPIEKLNDFELGYSINEQKIYIKEVKNGAATLRSFSSDGKMNESLTQINSNIDSLSNALTTLQTLLNPTKAGAFYATGADTTPVFGTLPVKYGGTGRTSNPKMLVNLASTSAAKVFAANPSPGVTGTLPIANGGTGLTASPSLLINLASTSAADVLQESPRPGVSGTLPIARGGTGATTAEQARTNLGVAAESHNHSASNITSGTLSVKRGGTGASLSSAPSLLTNLASTSAASIFSASPRPGVTGTLPVANGGTGAIDATEACKNLGALKIDHLGILIASGTNLNTLTTPDVYYSPNQTTSGSLVNTPFTSSGFKLIVMTGYSSQRVIQMAFDNAAAGYIRVYTSSKWTEWRYF